MAKITAPPRGEAVDPDAAIVSREAILDRYKQVRAQSHSLARPITPEDAQVQSMPDASPAKWNLAHTTWFFETFILENTPDYEPLHPEFRILFNSYYNTVGDQHPRPKRGVLSRPSLEQVYEYRRRVDEAITKRIEAADESTLRAIAPLVALGLAHEEQHQELLLTDILHAYSCNPLEPAYRDEPAPESPSAPQLEWHDYDEGVHRIGHEGAGFAFDNEKPRHRVFIHAFQLASRLVTNGEFMEFMADGGYERADLWLSDGWATINDRGWRAPMYWEKRDDAWHRMTLYGMKPVDPEAPVCHVSYYEADAFATWADARLPTEAEWEVASAEATIDDGNLLGQGSLVPLAPDDANGEAPRQMFGDVWEWTRSAYSPYPGYRPAEGALGEYNAKFMCNQQVLRGGSCVTPARHIRRTYRNFFPADARWQFMGFRLAKDA